MSQGKNIAIAVLSVTTGISAFWAWSAEHKLSSRENGTALAPATVAPQPPNESTELDEAAAAAKSTATTPQTPADSIAATAPQTPIEHGEPADLRAIRESPEFQRLKSLARQGVLDYRYADLFRKLNLTPEELEKLKALLVERQNIRGDVMAASRQEGLNLRENRDAIQNLIRENEADSNAALRSLLGEAGYETFAQYESTQTERNLARQIDQRFSYTATPLSASQSEQLITLLATARTAQNPQRPGAVMLNDTVIAQARGFLTPTQVDALVQMQTEVNAVRNMAQLLRAQGIRRMPAINSGAD